MYKLKKYRYDMNRNRKQWTLSLNDELENEINNYKKIPNIINCGYGTDYTIKKYYQIIADELNYKGKFIFQKRKIRK